MKAAIIPGFSELLIFINLSKEVTRVGLPSIIMPWLYAPWPEARKKGIVHINVLGETLRMLLEELSQRYKQTDVDFDPLELTNRTPLKPLDRQGLLYVSQSTLTALDVKIIPSVSCFYLPLHV